MRKLIGLLLVSWVLPACAQMTADSRSTSGRSAEAKDMALVGYDDLQNRSAYQPVTHHQGNRFIAYIGHHGGSALNPLTGKVEPNGTSIVDVTDPHNPKYLAHIPGSPEGAGEAGGAQMVRVCDGKGFSKGDPNKTYLLRTLGNEGHEILDVTDPSNPKKVSTVISGQTSTHKNWWECDTGIAYIVTWKKADGWRSRGVKIYDLSDPEKPRFIRDYGLVGQEPGSKGEPIPQPLHGPIRLGNRVYFGYGTSISGTLQIVDRDKPSHGQTCLTESFRADGRKYSLCTVGAPRALSEHGRAYRFSRARDSYRRILEDGEG